MRIVEGQRVLYVDSSAIVKLVVPEAESQVLREHLLGAELVTSVVALTEVPRAAHVRTRSADVLGRAEVVLRRFDLVALDAELCRLAARREPRELRALDAIHLESALRLGDRLTAIVVYDRRLGSAAREAGLAVDAPGA